MKRRLDQGQSKALLPARKKQGVGRAIEYARALFRTDSAEARKILE
jgi:hypothetical protein